VPGKFSEISSLKKLSKHPIRIKPLAMAVQRKRASDFFSVEDSDELDHEVEDEPLDQGFTNPLDEPSESEQEEQEEELEESRILLASVKRKYPEAEEDEEEEEEVENDHESNEVTSGDSKRSKVKDDSILSEKKLEKTLAKLKKSGVVYISRIPPYMKPVKLRQILSRFGEVNRIFLTPEDAKTYAKRVKFGGNKKKNYTEGWAEFVKKKDAKLAADALNGNKIGGKKGSYYYDDILNIKYLHKFKWNNLTEQIALENQSRHEKLRAEISQATRENRIFMENVEAQKMISKIEEKRAEKGGIADPAPKRIRRTFEQKDVFSKRASQTENKKKDENSRISGVLKLI
jgi:ESF2/ABP1 family protein